jgi:hypothetical protein
MGMHKRGSGPIRGGGEWGGGMGWISSGCRACRSFGGKGSMQQQENIKVLTLGLLEFGCHLPYKIQSCSAAQF